LLADGAPALADVMVGVVGDRGPRDAAEVDATVLVEGPVLDRDGRQLDEGRHLLQRDDDAMIARQPDVIEENPVAVEDQRVLVEPAGGEAFDGRQGADAPSRQRRGGHQGQSEDHQQADQQEAPGL